MTLDGKIASADDDPLAVLTLLAARDQVFRSLMAAVQRGIIRPYEDEGVKRVVGSSLRLRVVRNDLEASAYLEGIVESVGWPSEGWGRASRDAAWMIVQHSDRTPELQIAALRAMEDPERQAAYGPGNYALLYDRVTLALSGRQRYGTQVRCVDGQSVPAGLEQPVEVDARRAAMGLGPLPDYLAVVGDSCAPRH